jgi:hypothetical protein
VVIYDGSFTRCYLNNFEAYLCRERYVAESAKSFQTTASLRPIHFECLLIVQCYHCAAFALPVLHGIFELQT